MKKCGKVIAALQFNKDIPSNSVFEDTVGFEWQSIGTVSLDKTTVKFGQSSFRTVRNSRIRIVDNSILPSILSNGTIEFWSLRSGNGWDGGPLYIGTDNGDDNKNFLELYVYSNMWLYHQNITDFNVPSGWVHWAFVFKDGYLYVFLNGILSKTTKTVYNHYSTNYIWLNSARLSSRFMDGYIDEVIITDTAKWTSDFTPPTSEYTNHYKLMNKNEDMYGII